MTKNFDVSFISQDAEEEELQYSVCDLCVLL
jgi:hypothetical protein